MSASSQTEDVGTAKVCNLSTYKFVALDDLPERRAHLRKLCDELELKGTILLSREGINLFVAGAQDAVESLLSFLRSNPALADLGAKLSFSDEQPFRRMLVKIKREIIAFGVPEVQPQVRTSPKLSPHELRQWLREGRSMVLLDVRNDYEVALGTFADAMPIGVAHFRDFPERVRQLPETMKKQTVVMFCTGGIRCEKAGPFMEQEGFEHILQLDGGILRYFEECGAEHYHGDCFVFDHRVSVDPDLAETSTALCFVCQATLSEEDQRSERYVVGQSCPYCYRTVEQRAMDALAKRNAQIQAVVRPLPGSQPYVNRRPMHVRLHQQGLSLFDFVSQVHPHIPRTEWERICAEGKLVRRDVRLRPDDLVQAGDRIEHLIPDTVEPDVNSDIRVIYEDQAIVVVDKPAPLPMHPCGRFNRNSLSSVLAEVYRPERLRIVHRLDADTTGIVVLARTRSVASRLQPQFASDMVSKTYRALVHGHPEQNEFECELPIGREPATAGTRRIEPDGHVAVTRFRVLERREDGTTLLEVVPVTGRTNQIRLHAIQLGWPIVGDEGYARSTDVSDDAEPPLTRGINDPPLCLHAYRLCFRHPIDGGPITLTSAALPGWAQ